MRIKFQSILFCLFLTFFFTACKSSHKETECQKIRDSNRVAKKVTRHFEDNLISLEDPKENVQSYYPWEQSLYDQHPFITKEFFRCKGSPQNPSFLNGTERIFDCNGSSRHSLPLKEGREFVYPILIDLLNFVQKELNAKVIITCGHRCPQHNRYSDLSEFNRTSKHMIGAEVDFYVKGYEKEPLKVIQTLMKYYLSEKYDQKKAYQLFQRYTKNNLNVSTNPWYNHEVFIKLYKSTEGRDKENSHPYPYISVQVRNDEATDEKVTYTWQGAFYNYLRY